MKMPGFARNDCPPDDLTAGVEAAEEEFNEAMATLESTLDDAILVEGMKDNVLYQLNKILVAQGDLESARNVAFKAGGEIKR